MLASLREGCGDVLFTQLLATSLPEGVVARFELLSARGVSRAAAIGHFTVEAWTQ